MFNDSTKFVNSDLGENELFICLRCLCNEEDILKVYYEDCFLHFIVLLWHLQNLIHFSAIATLIPAIQSHLHNVLTPEQHYNRYESVWAKVVNSEKNRNMLDQMLLTTRHILLRTEMCQTILMSRQVLIGGDLSDKKLQTRQTLIGGDMSDQKLSTSR